MARLNVHSDDGSMVIEGDDAAEVVEIYDRVQGDGQQDEYGARDAAGFLSPMDPMTKDEMDEFLDFYLNLMEELGLYDPDPESGEGITYVNSHANDEAENRGSVQDSVDRDIGEKLKDPEGDE